MKTIFIYFIFFGVFYSCAAPLVSIGSTEQDFIKKYRHRAKLAESSTEWVVYSLGDVSLNKQKFYYFENGFLIKIDGGERQPDIREDIRVEHKYN